jgi:hypothetical protein
MITVKDAKDTLIAVKDAAVEQMSHITTNEKIAGAAAIGVVVGAAAGAIGSSMLHSGAPEKEVKAVEPPAA